MLHKIIYPSLLSLLLATQGAHSVYVTDIEHYNVFENDTDKFPYACRIDIQNDKASAGTGSLIRSDVVLTVAHVVCAGNDATTPETAYHPSKINVSFFKDGKITTHGVRHVVIPNSSQNSLNSFTGCTDDNLALLFLLEPVQNIKPQPFKSFTKDTKLPSVTIMGFGQGGLLDPENFPDADLPSSTEVFRYVENLKGDIEIRHFDNRISITQNIAKVASGDSGGPLLDDEDGKIIGVAQSGTRALIDLLSPEEEIDRLIKTREKREKISTAIAEYHLCIKNINEKYSPIQEDLIRRLSQEKNKKNLWYNVFDFVRSFFYSSQQESLELIMEDFRSYQKDLELEENAALKPLDDLGYKSIEEAQNAFDNLGKLINPRNLRAYSIQLGLDKILHTNIKIFLEGCDDGSKEKACFEQYQYPNGKNGNKVGFQDIELPEDVVAEYKETENFQNFMQGNKKASFGNYYFPIDEDGYMWIQETIETFSGGEETLQKNRA